MPLCYTRPATRLSLRDEHFIDILLPHAYTSFSRKGIISNDLIWIFLMLHNRIYPTTATAYRISAKALMSVTALILLMHAVPAMAAQPQPAPQSEEDHSFITMVNDKWIGGFDGMKQRRMIRALVVYSKTHFFFDKSILYSSFFF